MLGLMQTRPLLVSSLIDHAAKQHGDTEVISRGVDKKILRTDWATTGARAKRLAKALIRAGVVRGDCVASLAWNTHRHLEYYYGVAGMGAICHTINPRLFLEQIQFIVEHAQDKLIFFDVNLLELVQKISAVHPVVKFVAMGELPAGHGLKHCMSYEDMLAAETDDYEWQLFDENTASGLCYTSGTTGNPKGVLYSNRSVVLHSYAGCMPDSFNISAADVVLPGSSMYHANAWGIPHAATLAGSKMVLPGPALDGESIVDLIEQEAVTLSSGVPTVWSGVMQYLEKSGRTLKTLRRLIVAGSACPPSLMRYFADQHGTDVVQMWGMTETSPLGTMNIAKAKHASLPPEKLAEVREKQGRAVFGLEMKIVDDNKKPLPHDGVAYGDFMVRGWWVTEQYYKLSLKAIDEEGWFHTGDVATIDPDGFMRITDRSKDVIKSGGEWISSIDLENAAVAHPAVVEAAVIGVHHPKWEERPLLLLHLKEGMSISKDEMNDFLKDKVVKWWLPDDVVQVKEIPHTATGKILKTKLREDFKNHFMERK